MFTQVTNGHIYQLSGGHTGGKTDSFRCPLDPDHIRGCIGHPQDIPDAQRPTIGSTAIPKKRIGDYVAYKPTSLFAPFSCLSRFLLVEGHLIPSVLKLPFVAFAHDGIVG